MSIFNDKKLIERLVTHGAISAAKQAQVQNNPYANPPPQAPEKLTPEQTASYNLAKKMVMDLLEQIAPNDPDVTKKVSPVGFEGGSEASLKPDNLKDLGDLINWAATNGLTWHGKRVAWINNPPQEANVWSFKAYSQDRSVRDPATRKVSEFTAYADKPALLSFLSYLKDSDEAKNEKPYQVQLSKIIGQVNEYLEKNEQIDAKPTASKGGPGTGNAAGLDPNAVVDAFPSSILDMTNKYAGVDKQPIFEGMSVPLTVQNISNRDAFASWLNNMKIKTDKGEGPAFSPETDNACIAVNILYLRAKYLKSVAINSSTKPNYTKMVDTYLQNIQEFGKTFTGANGKSCSVVSPTEGDAAAGGAAGGTGAGAGSDGTGASGKAVAPGAVGKVADVLPLTTDDIDFGRIQAFFTAYAPLASPQAQTYINECLGYISKVWTGSGSSGPLVKGRQASFNLYAGPNEIATWLSPPAGSNYISFISALEAILRDVSLVLKDFFGQYKFSPELRGERLLRLRGQIEGSNSIWQGNWETIESWKSRGVTIMNNSGKSGQ